MVGTSTAPTLLFSVLDVFGQTVDIGVKRWNDYVLKKRPQFAGHEQLVKDAINVPDRVLEGNTPEHKEFWGARQPGKGFHFGGASVVAVVWYPSGSKGNGVLTTAYVSTSTPAGNQLWP